MKNRNMAITIGITSFLFTFILVLVYLVYCYAYYDEYQETVFVDYFNKLDFKYVYDNSYDKNRFTFDDFKVPIDLMYDKNNLKSIYNEYYSSSDNYKNVEDFISEYYYGDVVLKNDDFVFEEIGKTDLFHRKNILYKTINVQNKVGNKSSLGIKKDIKVSVENNAKLVVDGERANCHSNECYIAFIYGGLHKIEYHSNSIDYFGIINVYDDNQVVDITMIDSLVRVAYKNDSENKNEDVINKPIVNASLKNGQYKLQACYLSSSCPTKKDSYLRLYDDGTVDYYLFVSLSQAGDTYNGTYRIEGNFLILNFNHHIYSVFDYDTKTTSKIESYNKIEIRFRIDNDSKVTNDSYSFTFEKEYEKKEPVFEEPVVEPDEDLNEENEEVTDIEEENTNEN